MTFTAGQTLTINNPHQQQTAVPILADGRVGERVTMPDGTVVTYEGLSPGNTGNHIVVWNGARFAMLDGTVHLHSAS